MPLGPGARSAADDAPSDRDAKDRWVEHVDQLGGDVDGLTKDELIDEADRLVKEQEGQDG